MIENFQITFNKNEKAREFNLKENLGILIGKNGIGKTTIIKILFHTLNADLTVLKRLPFESITINLINSPNRLKIEKIIKCIEVKKVDSNIEITYKFDKRKKLVKIITKTTFFAEAIFEIKSNNLRNNTDLEHEDLFNKPTSMEELIAKNKEELNFINEIKKSILYFPTYRRLDNDLYDLSMSNPNVFNKDEHIKNFMSEYPVDKRILGVDENDIQALLENYSESLRVYSSTALNKVLASFVEQTIKSIYDRPTMSKKRSTELFNSAAQTLITLSKQLNLEVDEDKIIKHYNRQKNINELLLKNGKTKVAVDISLTDTHDDSDKVTIEKVLRDKFFDKLFYEETIIMSLLELYGQYSTIQENDLEKFYLLQSILEKFFKDKIQIQIDKKDYIINLTKKFTSLSSGEKQILTFFNFIILGTLDTAYFPFVIIDEPEISLHVEWQYNLIEQFIRIPNVTYFMATHSPYVSNADYQDYMIKGGIGGTDI